MSKKPLTVEEFKTELKNKGIQFPPTAKKAELIALLPQIPPAPEPPQPTPPPAPEPAKPAESLSFDVPGKMNHEKFDKGGKAEKTFIALCNQPKKIAYIPLEAGDVPGTTSAIKQFCYNRIRINVVKGVSVEMPQSLAEYIEEIEAVKRSVMNVKTKDLNTGGMREARLDLLSEAQKLGVL